MRFARRIFDLQAKGTSGLCALLVVLSSLLACSPDASVEAGRAREGLSASALQISDPFPIAPLVYREASPSARLATARSAAGEWLSLYGTDYQGTESLKELRAMRVSASGQRLDPRGIVIERGHHPLSSWFPRATHTGTGWMVVYSASAGVLSVPLSEAGMLGAQHTLSPDNIGTVGLIWGGERGLVTFSPPDNSTEARFIDDQGAPVGSSFSLATAAGERTLSTNWGASAGGTEYVILATVGLGTAVEALIVRPDQSVTSVTLSNRSGATQWADRVIALGPNQYRARYSASVCTGCGLRTFCRTLTLQDGDVSLGSPEDGCSPWPPAPSEPNVHVEIPLGQLPQGAAYASNRYLVAWDDDGAGVATYVSSTGEVPAEPFSIGSSGGSQHVTASNSDYLIALTDPAFVRIDADGTATRHVNPWTTRQFTPGVTAASDGSNFLIAWLDPFAAEVRAGLFAAEEFPSVAALPDVASNVSLSYDGANYVAWWAVPEAATELRIAAVRVNRAGHVVDCAARTVLTHPAYRDNPVQPVVAGGHAGTLVLWHEAQSSDAGDTGPFLVRGAVVDSELRLRSSTPADLTVTQTPLTVSAVWDGAEYWAVWREGANVVGKRIAADGVPLDAEPVPITSDLSASSGFALASARDGSTLVTYGKAGPAAQLHGRILRTTATVLVGAGAGGSGGASATTAGACPTNAGNGGTSAGSAAGGNASGGRDAAAGASGAGADGGSAQGGNAAAGESGESAGGRDGSSGATSRGGSGGNPDGGAEPGVDDGGETNGGTTNGPPPGGADNGGAGATTRGGSGSSAAASGATAGTAPGTDRSGCSCAAVPAQSHPMAWLVLAAACALLRPASRRRRTNTHVPPCRLVPGARARECGGGARSERHRRGATRTSGTIDAVRAKA